MVNSRKTLLRGRRIFCLCIASGIILHFVPYIYNRSLWVDEAMLASSLLTRGFSELVSFPLDFGQSAPVGYLYIVKSLTALLGSEEYVLRIWSLFSFVCCAYLFYLILSSVFSIKHPEVFTLVFVLVPFFLVYSNEFKPYMSDNMFVMLSLLLLGNWYRQKLSFSVLIASYSAIIWFSFASVFFIASAMIIITLELLHEVFSSENKLRAVLRLAGCMIVALSFGLYYKFWLSVSSSHAGGQEYFALTRFIFLPLSLGDIRTMIKIFHQILTPLLSVDYTFTALTGILALAGILELFRNSIKEVLAAIIGSVLVMCIASSIGFYPIVARLTQFISVEILILAAVGFEVVGDKLCVSGNKISFIALILLLALVPALKFMNNIRPSKVYRGGEEAADNIHYLRKNLKPEDKVYIAFGGIPLFLYENNYSGWEPLYGKTWTDLDLPSIKDRYIYGQRNMIHNYKKSYGGDGHISTKAVSEDISIIIQYPSVYIFSSHSDKGVSGISAVVEGLRRYGDVEEVVSLHDNPLYHFKRAY